MGGDLILHTAPCGLCRVVFYFHIQHRGAERGVKGPDWTPQQLVPEPGTQSLPGPAFLPSTWPSLRASPASAQLLDSLAL